MLILLIVFGEWGRKRERGTSICCPAYSCIHWLILVLCPMGDQTCNLGIVGQCRNQLSYPARAWFTPNCFFINRVAWTIGPSFRGRMVAVWPTGVEGAELGLNGLVAGHTHPVLPNSGQTFSDVPPLPKGQESTVNSLKRREVFCFAEWKIWMWEPGFCLESL